MRMCAGLVQTVFDPFWSLFTGQWLPLIISGYFDCFWYCSIRFSKSFYFLLRLVHFGQFGFYLVILGIIQSRLVSFTFSNSMILDHV